MYCEQIYMKIYGEYIRSDSNDTKELRNVLLVWKKYILLLLNCENVRKQLF